jgi:hypothetical protein
LVYFWSYLAYNTYVVKPKELEASNDLSYARGYFDKAETAGSGIDSLYTLGLEGADGKYGFLDIAETYSGTDAANMANYYAGLSYLKMNQYDNAISYLEKFNSKDAMLGPISIGAIGDAFAEINQPEQALEFYEKAANKTANEFSTPLFLYKAGLTAMQLKNYDKALSLLQKLKKSIKNHHNIKKQKN